MFSGGTEELAETDPVRIYEVNLLQATPPPEGNSVHSLVTNGVGAVRTRNVWPVVTGIQVKGISQG